MRKEMLEKVVKKVARKVAYGAVAGLIGIAGCGGVSSDWQGIGSPCAKPGWRKGYYATASAGTIFLGPQDLGTHGRTEGNGQVYTCKAGHIDIAHLRKAADWTAFLSQQTYENLMKGKKEFPFKLVEPSQYYTKINYPAGWDNMSVAQKQAVAREVSIDLGQYFSYIGCTWHEMLTWFGYKITGVWSEFPSSFGWEDQFSNLLGSYCAAKSLRQGGNFNQTFTTVLNQELRNLGIQSKGVAKKASEKVRGDWWSGGAYFFVTIKGRNFDIGEDGYVTPWIIPIEECRGARPVPYPAPNGDISRYGFSMSLQIVPRTGSGNRISGIVNKSRINPRSDFPTIMNYLKKDAVRRWGPNYLKKK